MPATAYHCQARDPISRSAGRSAVACAAYRARTRLEDQRYGKTHDYSRHEGLEFVWHSAPKNAPDWAHDVGQAWNAVEARETRKNSVLAFDYDMAFPHQLNAEQREWMLKDWVREEFTRKGLMATAVIHAPSRKGDQRNYHGHCMIYDRVIDENGFAKNKDRTFSDYATRTEALEHVREKWAELGARQLERAGYPLEAERWRHGHKKLEIQCALAVERGDTAYAQELRFREATKHLGHVASAMEREGQESHRGNENREIEAGNAARQELGKELQAVEQEIAALEREPESNTIRLYRGIGNNVEAAKEGEAVFFSTDIERARRFGELHYVDVTADEFAQLKCPHSTRILEAEPIAINDYRISDPAILNRLRNLDTHENVAEQQAIQTAERRAASMGQFAQAAQAQNRPQEVEAALTAVNPEALTAVNAREEQKREERQATAAKIGAAWQAAERDPVAFAIGLGEQGLTLAENDKGRFVAVDTRGYVHSLSAAALGQSPREAQRDLAAAFKGENGLSLPSVDEVQAEIAEATLGQAAHRRADAAERAAQWELKRESWKEQRQLDRQIERIEAAQERPQNEVMQEIGHAWADSGNGAAFVEELEQRGFIVCRVTAEEAQRSQNQRAWLKTASYQEGDYLAVTEWGAAYRLNAETIGLTATNIYDHLQNVTERLAEIEPDSVVTFHEAQDIITAQRAEQTAAMESPMIEIAESIGDGIEAAIDTADHAASKGFEIVGRMGAVIANGLESFFFGGASRQAPGGAEYEAPQTAAPYARRTPEPPVWKKAKIELDGVDMGAVEEPQAQAKAAQNPLQTKMEMIEELARRARARAKDKQERDNDDWEHERER